MNFRVTKLMVSLALGLAFAVPCSPGIGDLKAQEIPDLNLIERIKDEGLNRSQVLGLYTHLTDAIGPRLAGTPAFKKAADWAVANLQGWGLDEVHLRAGDDEVEAPEDFLGHGFSFSSVRRQA